MPGEKATASFLIALNAEAGAPAEIMLLPSGASITTVDGRGPYRVPDAAKLIAESLQASGGRMPVDENHSIDLAAPKGEPSPARGWMTDLQARADGIWAPVDWNDAGKQLLAERAYCGISVVFNHREDGTITRILRASLTNKPNLRGLVALHQEQTMEALFAKLRTLLGLDASADDNAVYEAVSAIKNAAIAEKAKAAAGVATQAQLTAIAKVAGLKEDADGAAVLATVTTLATDAKKASGADAVTALQAELTKVTTDFIALQASLKSERATTFVDAAIKAGRVGVKPLRDHYIAMHAVDATRVEKEINAMPVLGPSGTHITPPKDKDGKLALNAAQQTVANILGLKPEDMVKTLETESRQAAA